MQKRGFSLMEMMVVMLIVAVIAAASAPMISKKMVQNASSDSPWIWTSATNNSIAFNLKGSDSSPATIGATKPLKNIGTMFHINTKNNDIPQITLSNPSNTDESAKLAFLGNNNYFFTTDYVGKIDNTKNSIIMGSGTASSTGFINNKVEDSVLIGHNAGVQINAGGGDYMYSVSLGSRASGKGNKSVSIGYNSTAAAPNTVSIGYNTYAEGAGAIAIGDGGASSEQTERTYAKQQGISIGSYAFADQNSIAIGSGTSDNRTKANENSIAIGVGAQSAIGTNNSGNSNSNKDSIVIGNNSNSGGESVVIGHGLDTKYGTTGGFNYTNVFMLGKGSSVTGNNSCVFGKDNTSGGGVAIGESVTAGSQGVAIGYKDGETKTEAANYSVAIGKAAVTSSHSAVAIGRNTSAESSAVAIGHNTEATEDSSTALGNKAKAEYKYSTAIGYNAKTNEERELVLGDENTTVYIPGKLKTASQLEFNGSLNITGDLYVAGKTYISTNKGSKKLLWTTDLGHICVTVSDRRLKNVGEVFKGGLEEIKKLEVFNYTFKKDPNKTPRVGVMAQDLEKIFPKAVFKGDDGFLRIRMEDMFYALVNAVKELDSKIDSIVADVKTALNDIVDLKKKSAEYEKTISILVEQNKAQDKAIRDLEKRLAKLEKKAKKSEISGSEE